MQTRTSDHHSLGWLLLSAIGGALAAIVVAGVIAGRAGLLIDGRWLLGAGLLGALPQLLRIARRRWTARWTELVAVLVGFAAVGGVGLALAWPSLLPLGFSVDAIHHTQLIAWMADHQALPTPDGTTRALLGEMAAYPIGLALLVLAAASGSGQPLLETTYPLVALLGGLIAAVVVLLSSAGGATIMRFEFKVQSSKDAASELKTQNSKLLTFLALLGGPLLLLAHRTYLMEAYIDHSYYTMVLGVLLVLVATAWLIIEPPRAFGAAAQFGLVLAALIGTYPLWAPLVGVLAVAMLLSDEGRRTKDERQRRRSSSFVIRPSSWLMSLVSRAALAFGPTLALALLDLLPRMQVGQVVLAHEGLVTLPTPQRLIPILLALPGALLVAQGRAGRRLVVTAALIGFAIAALTLAARGGLVAGYHSFKLLFVLTPLAAAIVGAALARLVAASAKSQRLSNHEARKAREAELEGARFRRQARNVLFMPALPTEIGATPGAAHVFSHSQMLHKGRISNTSVKQSTTVDYLASRSWRFIFEPKTDRNVAVLSFRRWLALGAVVLVLALTGSFQIIPAPGVQVITPDMVAATRWLRANAPKDAARAITVGMPAGPRSYWIEVGLLGQWRDKAAAARRDFTIAPPTHESWLIDPQLAPVAIGPVANMPLPGEATLMRFGEIAIVRRAAKLDPTPLNPLLIRYRSFWEDQRLKTAIELQRALPGPLPLLDVRLYHHGTPVAAFALPPEQERTRPQYLGLDLLPAALSAEGYINQSAYPVFDPPALAPTGALSLTLRLTIAGATIEERQLATFERAADGQITGLTPSSGELVYLRHDPAAASLRGLDRDFGAALRLEGWHAPATAHAGDPIAITLRWQAPRVIAHALLPELQLLNTAGQPVATNLAAPQDGFYPTWRWRPGESVAEQRRIQLPPDLAPGVYHVAVRVHDFAAGRALDVPGSADGLARIGEIVVEPQPQ